MTKHLTTIGNGFLDDWWSVTCSCGFAKDGFSTSDFAVQASVWHMENPTTPWPSSDLAS